MEAPAGLRAASRVPRGVDEAVMLDMAEGMLMSEEPRWALIRGLRAVGLARGDSSGEVGGEGLSRGESSSAMTSGSCQQLARMGGWRGG